MKRRSFLAMIGAAIATPALPMAAPANVSRATYGLALNHARTRPHVTARGLAYCLKVTQEQAASLMGELSAKGVVTPISASVDGTMRATSNILIKDPWGIERTSRALRVARQEKTEQERQSQAKTPAKDVDAMMAYLHQMCRDYGMALNPRCFA